jgi:hypothetical protein
MVDSIRAYRHFSRFDTWDGMLRFLYRAMGEKNRDPGRRDKATISARADPSALSLCHVMNTSVSLSKKAMDTKSFFGFSNIHAAWHIDCHDYLSREGKA